MQRGEKFQKSGAQGVSWIVGGALGGMTFQLVRAPISTENPLYWAMFLILLTLGIATGYAVVNMEPNSNEVANELNELKEEISALRDRLPEEKESSAIKETAK